MQILMKPFLLNLKSKFSGFHLSALQVLGLAVLLAPISYVIGFVTVSPAFVWIGLGMMAGIALGLALSVFMQRSAAPSTLPATNAPANGTSNMEKSILEQIKAELSENLALFEARKGKQNLFARIEYLTAFWESIKASGRLFVMSDPKLLATLGGAYYWLAQASHLEILAYEAKYAGTSASSPAAAQQLVGEARLLDGQLENALSQALDAIDTALAS
ncbi:MAG: hypothetical protein NVSMB39_0310 [Candidatus Saccharimonadales bacterium]